MRDLMAELKELRLHGMASAWPAHGKSWRPKEKLRRRRRNGCSNICFNRNMQIAPYAL